MLKYSPTFASLKSTILCCVLLAPGKPEIFAQQIPDSLASIITKAMKQNHVPCVGAGLIDNGKISWIKVFGNLESNRPAPVNTLFNIASQTKPVIAILTLQLVQSRQWSLDEPLAHYWIDPDISTDKYLNKLTTRLVLSHQTGFSNWRSDNSNGKLQFNAEPGTKFGYSGEGFEYLRKALEKKFHLPLDQLLDSILLKPLGMKDTRYWTSSVPRFNGNPPVNRFARWHNGQEQPYSNSLQTPVSAADDLITTIEDYCRFGIFVMNGAGLSDSLFNDMVKPQIQVKEHYFRGLGWGLITDLPDHQYALEHGGSDVGVRTMAVFLPMSKKGVVVMSNADNGMFISDMIIKQALAHGTEILATMNKGQTTHTRVVIPDSLLVQYAGTYSQSNGKQLKVVQTGNAILVSGDGAPTATLFPESSSVFFLPDYDVQMHFGLPGSPESGTISIFESGRQVMQVKKILSPNPR